MEKNKEKLSKIKKELYNMFIEATVGANKRVLENKIERVVEKLASAYNVDVPVVQEQLDLGSEIEKEHVKDNVVIQKIIALQHLVEELNYYTDNKPENWAEVELGKEEASKTVNESLFKEKEPLYLTTNTNRVFELFNKTYKK